MAASKKRVPFLEKPIASASAFARAAAGRYLMRDVLHTRKELDKVSPSFCLAKWLQVTVHLQNGTTHSCHHPVAHKIPIGELKKNPSALHNTQFKKEQRRQMLLGQRPAECTYCWKTEDAPGNHLSDRHFKSADEWARPRLREIAALPWDADVQPSYLEVSFGSLCNFKCAYCPPHISSGTLSEIKKFGPYPTSDPIHRLDENPIEDPSPYVASFWKWFPEVYPKLHTLRVTGGEPLLNENTFELLDRISRAPRPDLSLAINTNLGVPRNHLERFLRIARPIVAKKAVKELRLFTSLDTVGARAEYIRHGLDFKRFNENMQIALEALPSARLTILVTLNALAVSSFSEFLEYVLVLKEKYGVIDGRDRITVGISALHWPDPLCVKVLPDQYRTTLRESMQHMKSARSPNGRASFLESETEKLSRICDWLESSPIDPAWLKRAQKDFYLFFSEYDRRRQSDFLATFPEMAEFWEQCRLL